MKSLSTLDEGKEPNRPISDKTRALLATLPKDRITHAQFKEAMKMALVEYNQKIKQPHIKKEIYQLVPSFKVKNESAVFIDRCGLVLPTGGFFIPYFSDDINDYEIALDAYYHIPTEQEIEKITTLKFNKTIPKVFKDEIIKFKKVNEVPITILLEGNPIINRVMYACGSNKNLMILASLYLINPDCRLPVLCKLAGMNPGVSLINVLTYVQPIDALNL